MSLISLPKYHNKYIFDLLYFERNTRPSLYSYKARSFEVSVLLRNWNLRNILPPTQQRPPHEVRNFANHTELLHQCGLRYCWACESWPSFVGFARVFPRFCVFNWLQLIYGGSLTGLAKKAIQWILKKVFISSLSFSNVSLFVFFFFWMLPPLVLLYLLLFFYSNKIFQEKSQRTVHCWWIAIS